MYRHIHSQMLCVEVEMAGMSVTLTHFQSVITIGDYQNEEWLTHVYKLLHSSWPLTPAHECE